MRRCPRTHSPRLTTVAVAALMAAIALLAGGVAAGPARVLVVDSYHPGYPWGDGLRQGIHEAFGMPLGGLGSARGDVVLRLEFMDTKRHPEPAWAEAQALRIMGEVASWRPDAVIACDDASVRYLVLPHLLGSDLPVVYCGVNWDAAIYGLPADNVTGMIEVDQVEELVAALRPHANGDRLGMLLLDGTASQRDVDSLHRHTSLDPLVHLVTDYAGWKEGFVAMQDQVDMLLIKQNITGLPEWDLDDAVAFTAEATRIPTGTTTGPVMRCVVAAFIKNPVEQGAWAAHTTQQILAGTPAAAIEPAVNKESRVFLNMTLARKLGIRFPMELIERASFMEERWAP